MNLVDYVFGIAAVVGFLVFVLSLIVGFVHELARFWHWLTGASTTSRAKITVDEMYQTTPYAATRNAKQALGKGGKP